MIIKTSISNLIKVKNKEVLQNKDKNNESRSHELEQEHSQQPSYKVLPPETVCPDLKKERHLSYMLKDRVLKGVYPYRDKHKNVLGFVVRLKDQEGNKITPTLTYQETKENKVWRFKGFGEHRPLYGLERLTSEENKEKPVLIVEGEKTADHAQKIFNDHVVVSTHGGVGGIKKADLAPLQGRDITLWPDNDDVGIKAMHSLAERLHKEYHTAAKIVDIKQYPQLSQKWDLADTIPEHVCIKEILQKAKPYRNIEKDDQERVKDSLQKEPLPHVHQENLEQAYKHIEMHLQHQRSFSLER